MRVVYSVVMNYIATVSLAIVSIATLSPTEGFGGVTSVTPTSASPFAAAKPVSDLVLDRNRGGAFFPPGKATSNLRETTRNLSLVNGQDTQVAMDVWWATTGSELIAVSVRNAFSQP